MTIPVFLNVYKGLISPHLKFCNQAWYPRLKKNTRLNGESATTSDTNGIRAADTKQQ